MNGRTFRFEAEKSLRRDGACASGHLLAVNPKANLTIDGTYVIVIPLAGTARKLPAGETPAAIRR